MNYNRLLVLAATLMIAGCSAATSGTASPESDLPTAGQPLRTSQPEVLDMATFDPCISLTADQAASLGVTGPIRGSLVQDIGRSCQWRHAGAEPFEGYQVDGSDERDIDQLQRFPPDSPTLNITGHEAITGTNWVSDPDKSCQIIIDIKPGQVLEVAYDYGGALQMNRTLACKKALNAAELVMTTILKRTGG